MAKKAKSGNWTETEARRVLAECKASGLSMRAYAKLHGLRERRLYWWTKQLADARRSSRGAAVQFVPAVVNMNDLARTADATVSIRVGSKVTMVIAEPSSVSASWVAKVMTELERIACS